MTADVVVAFCSYQAAKYAVEHWHYSRSLPTQPIVKIGVWENGKFIGVILFGRGANKNIGRPYGLRDTEVCELTRVALTKHTAPVSQLVARAIKLLKQNSPGLRLIISFADPNEGHVGGIYQAGNWIYAGQTSPSTIYKTSSGKVLHGRQVSVNGVKLQYGMLRKTPKISECEKITQLPKHCYLYPLDRAMRKQIAVLAKPYPKKCEQSFDGETSDLQSEGAGSTPAVRSEAD